MTTTIAPRICSICEAGCGILVESEGARVLSVRPDPDDPISQGYICPKATAMGDVQNDPDRLRQPVRRTPSGDFEPISWEEAMAFAAEGLRGVRERHGADGVGAYFGNPIIHDAGALLQRTGLVKALGTRNVFGAGSQDVSPRFAASYYLYGNCFSTPVPDVDRTDYFLCLGANPVVSNGSALTAPNLRGRLRDMQKRGGKLVVVDPRRSETAKLADEHIAVRPGSDAALLLGMCAVLLREARHDEARCRWETTGWEAAVERIEKIDLDAVAAWTGVARETIERLARELADAPRAVAYSRIGICNGHFGTLATWAGDLLNLLAGNFGRVGGAMFPTPAVDIARGIQLTGLNGHGRFHTRVRGLPETMGELPSAAMAEEMETPGPGQIRGFVSFAGNPVLSTPNGRRLSKALDQLEFMVSIDLYVNETTRHADVILPPAWCLSEDHIDLFFPAFSARNRVRWNEPSLEATPGEPADWEILYQLSQRLGGGATGIPPVDAAIRVAERFGFRYTPFLTVDGLLRTGAHGDRYLPGANGLSLAKLKNLTYGRDFGPLQEGTRHRIFHRDHKIHLAAAPLMEELDRLIAVQHERAESDSMVLVGRRELRSNNSWLHNIEGLVSGRERCTLFVNPEDAERVGVADGEEVLLESRVHSGPVRVTVSDEMRPGVASLPHGWGHAESAAWQRVAGRRPGVSFNDWSDGEEVEGVVGQSILNGVPVQLRPLEASRSNEAETAA